MGKIRNLFLIVMAILVSLPILCFNWEKDSISPIDNRKLTEFSLESGDKTSMIESFVKDRIGFRSRSIDLYTELNDTLFGEMVHPTYMYGTNGHVFFKIGAALADKEFIDTFCYYLQKVQQYCTDRDVPFLYCINPSKTTVYNRYLPAGYTYRNDFLENLYESLERYGIHYISNVELLTDKSMTEQVYNVKYDAGHWNDLGCFYGTNHMLGEISKIFPAVKPHTKEDFEIFQKEETTLPVSHFQIQEQVPFYVNKGEEHVTNCVEAFSSIRLDKNYHAFGVFENRNPGFENLPKVLFFHGSYYNSRVQFYNTSFQESYQVHNYQNFIDFENRNPGFENLPKVLFFHGSYYNSRVQFYNTSFQESYQVHNYQNFIDFDYYFNLFKPDCVILETAEYATTRSNFDPERLREKQLNPPYETVKPVVHAERNMEELEYTIDTKDAITTVSLELERPYSYGYLLLGEEEFDLQISGTSAQCSIRTEKLKNGIENGGRVALFSNLH